MANMIALPEKVEVPSSSCNVGKGDRRVRKSTKQNTTLGFEMHDVIVLECVPLPSWFQRVRIYPKLAAAQCHLCVECRAREIYALSVVYGCCRVWVASSGLGKVTRGVFNGWLPLLSGFGAFRGDLDPEKPTFLRTYKKNHSREPEKGWFFGVQVGFAAEPRALQPQVLNPTSSNP